jgi:peptidoglycan/xylan/chitin deacetylase (PgdA/CDA1 family)
MTPLPRRSPELLAPARPVAAARRVPWALMYHCVGDPSDDPYQVTVSPDRLARQLRWLSRRGLTGVSMRELLAARARGRAARLVGLTFDDGYRDFLTEAVPLLRRYGHTATVFVLPGRLGGDNGWDPRGPRRPLLDAGGVRAAEAEGMEIGSHGLLHQDLTAADDAALAAEVAESRAWLADITGTVPGGFCYPYGVLDARVVRAVRAAGYAYGCAVDPGPLAGPYALPRAYVGQRDTSPRLHAKRALHRLRGARVPLPPEPEPDPHSDPDRDREPEPGGGPQRPGRRRTDRNDDTTGAGGSAAASHDTPAPPRVTGPPTEET